MTSGASDTMPSVNYGRQMVTLTTYATRLCHCVRKARVVITFSFAHGRWWRTKTENSTKYDSTSAALVVYTLVFLFWCPIVYQHWSLAVWRLPPMNDEWLARVVCRVIRFVGIDT